jgi:RsiW-degrading membrane proteinase PrsW (M82 family)
MQFSGLILSVLFGVVPMLVFAYVVYWVDRYEKEPVVLLGGVFLWGAIIAAGAAFVTNSFLGLGIYMFTGSQAFTELSTASAIAPVIEESLKGMACVLIFLFFRKEFDSILDGIVYAAITAIGFAATENIYYIYAYGFQPDGLNGILYMFFVRVILVGWQHPFYTSFIGIGLAISRLNKNPAIKLFAPILGWAMAVLTHSIHNAISTVFQGVQSLTVGIIFDWSGWIAMILFVVWALYREQKWIITQLREEMMNGVITLSQYHTASSAWAQTGARLRALFAGQYRRIDHFFELTAELAFKKHQAYNLGEIEENQVEIERMRTELGDMSPQVSI